jgi:hypothetical protein
LSATKAAAKARSSIRPSHCLLVVAFGAQPADEFGPRARPVGEQAIGVGEDAIGAGVDAQSGALFVAQFETDEQAVANHERGFDRKDETAIEVHRDATLATGRPEGADDRHEAPGRGPP